MKHLFSEADRIVFLLLGVIVPRNPLFFLMRVKTDGFGLVFSLLGRDPCCLDGSPVLGESCLSPCFFPWGSARCLVTVNCVIGPNCAAL